MFPSVPPPTTTEVVPTSAPWGVWSSVSADPAIALFAGVAVFLLVVLVLTALVRR